MSDAKCPKCAEGFSILFEPVRDESPAGCLEVLARLLPGGAVTATGGFREFEAEARCAACGVDLFFESERRGPGRRGVQRSPGSRPVLFA